MSNKDDKDKVAFIASKELSDKIKKLQEELELESPGQVISMGISMVELALGRDIEFQDKKHKYKISKFAKYNQTVMLDDGDSES